MPNEPRTRAFCRECAQKTWHDNIGSRCREEIEVEGDQHCPPVWSENMYELLECRGCGCVTMRCTTTCEQLYENDKPVRYFPPSSSRRRPPWEGHLPSKTSSLLRQVYDALHSGSRRLAMMGARSLVDMTILDKVGDVGTFGQKLQALESEGYIGRRNREVLSTALDAGNAAAHRGHEHNVEEVNQVMDIVENLLQAVYVLERTAEGLKKSTPPRVRAGAPKPSGGKS